MEIAARYLATRPRSRWEVERRLRRAGTDPSTSSATLDRLASLGYLDDVAFARWWMEQRDRHAPRGRRMIEAELRQHGVGRAVLEELQATEVVSPHDDERLPATELERATVALDRHLRGRPLPTDRSAQQRIGMFLVRRGFDPQTVRTAIGHAGATDAMEDE